MYDSCKLCQKWGLSETKAGYKEKGDFALENDLINFMFWSEMLQTH